MTEQKERIRIELADGKYTYIADDKGSRALRYGEEWRDLTGDNLVGSMAYEIEALRKKVKDLQEELKTRKRRDDV